MQYVWLAHVGTCKRRSTLSVPSSGIIHLVFGDKFFHWDVGLTKCLGWLTSEPGIY